MSILIIAALIVAYVGYTFVYSINHGFVDAAILIAVMCALIAGLLWCEVAWSVMQRNGVMCCLLLVRLSL